MLTLPDLLDQGEIWIGRNEYHVLTEIPLDEMDEQHLKNLRAWLISRADQIQYAEVAAFESATTFVQGDQASLDLERLAEQDPVTWLREQPLLLAIDECLARRMNLARH
jgi:hypothetical protein